MNDNAQAKMEKRRITIGSIAIVAIVSITSIVATLLGMAQMV